MIVDCAVYSKGERHERPQDLVGIRSDADHARGFAWVGLVEPTLEEFEAVRREFDLHELAVEDAVAAHERPKLEHYADMLFLVLKTAAYSQGVVQIGEVMIFVGSDFVITARHGEATGGLGDVREHLEARPELLRRGPRAALHALLDRVVDAYEPVIDSLRDDIEQVESEVFAPAGGNPVQRIYELRRQVLELGRAVAPLRPALDALTLPDVPGHDPELLPYFRDVADHAARVSDHIDGFGALLTGALQANLTQVSVRQNEDMRRISAWVAILAVPTMVAGIYGMNFEHMPELEWRYGYPTVLLAILVACIVLFRRFRRSGWL